MEGSSLKRTVFPTQPSTVARSFLSRVWIPVDFLFPVLTSLLMLSFRFFVLFLFACCFGLFETIPCCLAQAGLEFIGLVIDSLASFVAEITVVYHQA